MFKNLCTLELVGNFIQHTMSHQQVGTCRSVLFLSGVDEKVYQRDG